VYFLAAPWRAVALNVADQEFFEMVDHRAAIGAQLGNLDQPFAAQVLECLFAGDVRQLIAEILAGQDRTRA
jgi:hypothetical protein